MQSGAERVLEVVDALELLAQTTEALGFWHGV